MPELTVETTPVPGLLTLRLPLHEDSRGWFTENWQREKMVARGLPDFAPVQHNLAFNLRRGVTRGVHAEPWDKLVSVATGRVFAAWVDLREGPSFGTVHHEVLDPGRAVFVPRGVGNAYQALETTCYSYLVNQHWRPDATYAALDLADPTAAIPWPVPLAEAEISAKDRDQPHLAGVTPFPARRPLVLGGSGQVGRALRRVLPDARFVDIDELDLGDAAALEEWPWEEHDVVVNAAGYTAVDAAETVEGRAAAWRANAEAPAALARLSGRHGFVLVHYSSDYVFDGTRELHDEDEPLSPLGVYGQSKAAGDLAVLGATQHYLIRTSWVVGEGRNFVRTMLDLAHGGMSPEVVDDQVGRLTFADELARATCHLLDTGAPFGTYNCTGSGTASSWADVARAVFSRVGRAAEDVTPISTETYAAARPTAPRPRHSTLDLSRLRATGFEPEDATAGLVRYLRDHEDGRNR